ncbi:ABC transporter permease [Cohaesibacter celericrescens]|uniref:ABC transporter permease n=1 Tax=Cohaesibacter celericrescens TaxID=2067669 RepID=A0A2N5XSZ3_9HYPH|nr:ABC transporter permease [Cohaesibacter celericrescens]PLW77624.1 ABC transporter permease [Cohaesibacter celericrescens]
MEFAEALLISIVTASTPLLLASLGELIVERSGVLNLGVEGMMIMGAVCAFATSLTTGNPYLGILAGVAGGIVMSLLFGVLTLTLVANQVATGLALTLLGLGISGMIGENFVGTPGVKLMSIDIPFLSDLPIIGKGLFSQDILFYSSFALVIGVSWLLFKSRWGLILRAVGENHTSAHALGYDVIRVRYWAVLFGGFCAGLSGAYLSLVYTNLWIENMTAGRGWIALALVVFSSWLPGRIAVGAYLFGAVSILQFHAQGAGWDVPSQLLAALPYLATIVALVVISRNRAVARVNTPSCLGQPFVPDR